MIRRLIPSDAQAYRQLMLEAYANYPKAFTSSVQERALLPLSWWETRLEIGPEADQVVFGAFSDNNLYGAAGVSFEKREKTQHKANLFGMYVSPAFRQNGAGQQLVHAVLNHARARDFIQLVQLTVSEGNHSAQQLYARCGFVPFGVEPCALKVGEQFVSKVHMWCEIAR